MTDNSDITVPHQPPEPPAQEKVTSKEPSSPTPQTPLTSGSQPTQVLPQIPHSPGNSARSSAQTPSGQAAGQIPPPEPAHWPRPDSAPGGMPPTPERPDVPMTVGQPPQSYGTVPGYQPLHQPGSEGYTGLGAPTQQPPAGAVPPQVSGVPPYAPPAGPYPPGGQPGYGYPPPVVPPSAPPPKSKRKGILVGVVAVLVLALLAGVAAAVALTRTLSGERRDSSIASPTAPSLPRQPKLRIAFLGDESRTYAFNMKMSMKGSGTGEFADDSADGAIDFKMSGTMKLDVIERLPDGSTRIELTFPNMSVSVSGPGFSQNFDASSASEFGKAMTQRYLIRPDGSFTLESVGGADVGAEIGAPPLTGSGSSQFGPFAPAPILPDHDVKIGDSWQQEFETKAPFDGGSLKFKITSTYEKDDSTKWGRAMVIRSAMQLESSGQIDPSKTEGASGGPSARKMNPLNYKMSGTLNAKYWFVPELGEAVKMDVERPSTIRMTSELTDRGLGTMSLEMDISMSMDRQ